MLYMCIGCCGIKNTIKKDTMTVVVFKLPRDKLIHKIILKIGKNAVI